MLETTPPDATHWSLRSMAQAVAHAPSTSLNLIRKINDNASLKVRRKTIGCDDTYLLAALTGPKT